MLGCFNYPLGRSMCMKDTKTTLILRACRDWLQTDLANFEHFHLMNFGNMIFILCAVMIFMMSV